MKLRAVFLSFVTLLLCAPAFAQDLPQCTRSQLSKIKSRTRLVATYDKYCTKYQDKVGLLQDQIKTQTSLFDSLNTDPANNLVALRKAQNKLKSLNRRLAAAQKTANRYCGKLSSFTSELQQLKSACVDNGPSSNPASKQTWAPSPALGTYRYIRLDITRQGWIAIREIQVIDPSGKKIKATNAAASWTYDGTWQSPRVPAQVAGFVIDEKESTAWNSGETDWQCRVRPDPFCPFKKRIAWIQVDLGGPKDVARVRVLNFGDSPSDTTVAKGSTDGTNFTDLVTYDHDEPIKDMQLLTFPKE